MRIADLYNHLLEKHGLPKEQWELWCKRPKTANDRELVIIGAILTQRTNWKNVELAMKNLKAKKLDSMENIYRAGPQKLAAHIKPAGFYKQKSRYLCNVANFFVTNNIKNKNLPQLRKELLNVKGVGPETADSILLYALDKPVFVIDEYTRRLVKKYGLSKNLSYEHLQCAFESKLERNHELYQDLHALIIIDGKKKT